MRIEPMDADRLDEVAAMEARDGDAHWSRAQFEKELGGEFRRFFLAVEPPDLLGYAGYWKADSEAQITNIVVRQESRCQGIGRRLVEFLLDCAASEMCTSCTLEVRKSNAHAQSLYRSLGFEVKGMRKKIYQNPEEDAVLMEKKL
jgi:ribosomal-protein-alanine N-acetyltransferase